MLFKPSPTRTRTEFGNGVIPNAKSCGNVFVNHSAGSQFSDFVDLLLFGRGVIALFPALAIAMFSHIFHVGFMGAISKIGYAVVGIVPVIVANLKIVRVWANKVFCNNKMNSYFAGFSVFGKNNVISALFVFSLNKISCLYFSEKFSFVMKNYSFKTAKFPHVGNFIKAFKARYWQPNFLHIKYPLVKYTALKVQGRLCRFQVFGSYPSLATPL